MDGEMSVTMYDVIGVGLGPFNLGLAALLSPLDDVEGIFFDKNEAFAWHPGMLLEGCTLQVPFMADVATMADPTNPYTFLNYLRHHNRLYRFYFYEKFHVPRTEYSHYCRWVAEQLPNCCFDSYVEAVGCLSPAENGEGVWVRVRDQKSNETQIYEARRLVLGVGSHPRLPEWSRPYLGEHVFHSSEFLQRRDACRKARSITVVGSGQSAAEIFHVLLSEQPHYGYEIRWLTRSSGFFPMEYSKLGLEHFSPEYVDYFYRLRQEVKDQLRANQDLLYKGIGAGTIAAIYDLLYERTVGGDEPPAELRSRTALRGISRSDSPRHRYRLDLKQVEEGTEFSVGTDCVVLATGYRDGAVDLLSGLLDRLAMDDQGRPAVTRDYRLRWRGNGDPTPIYVQNAEIHTHGVGAPDLGLGAYRNSVLINDLLGRTVYPVRDRNVFQHFGSHSA